MTNITIQDIDKSSPYLEQVRLLGDKNASTLGFLTPEAYRDHASRKWILIALDEDRLAGYLIYRVVKRVNQARIVHMCIDANYRGKGIPKKLFDELSIRTQPLYGIGLLCKRDYSNANKLWTKLGFNPLREKPGRSQKHPSELTFWWFPHPHHKTLFDMVTLEKIQVAIDANIFFDFGNTKKTEPESLALKSDWLKEEIELVITPELLHEINRAPIASVRDKERKRAQGFAETKQDHQQFEVVLKWLKSVYPTKLTESAESDLRQITGAVVDPDVNFFVTRDENLLKLAEAVFEEYGLSIYHPVDLILHLDELYRIEEYRLMRLAGTNFKLRRIQAGDSDDLAPFFQNDALENKSEFLRLLRQYLVNPDIYWGFLAEENRQSPLALYVCNWSNQDQLTIPLLRVNRNNADKKLLRYLLLQLMSFSAQRGRSFLCISDPHIQEVVKEALQEDTFTHIDKLWFKPTLFFAKTAQETGVYLQQALNKLQEVRPYYQLHVKLLQSENSHTNLEAMSEIERLFWPVKIIDADIPSITIPINSHWAYMWFDEKLASQTLLGALPDRAFNREGVYYSGAKPPNISLPGRILWYVTKDDRAVGTQAIRACSRLDSITIGKPKDLFRQFQHLGIYEWKNISDLVSGNMDREIVAYRFSDTQLFENPVVYEDWKRITIEEKGKNPPNQSPAIMPQRVFERVYKLGMNLS